MKKNTNNISSTNNNQTQVNKKNVIKKTLFCLLVSLVMLLAFYGCYSLASNIKHGTLLREPTKNVVLVKNPYYQLTTKQAYSFEEKLNTVSLVSLGDIDYYKNYGKEIPDVDLKTYDGTTVNLSKLGTNFVLEVIADWCDYCQMESKEYLNEIVEHNPDIKIVQYLITGGTDSAEKFFANAEIEPNPNVIMCLENDEFSTFINNALDLNAFPYHYFFLNGKCMGQHEGLMDNNSFKDYKTLIYSDNALADVVIEQTGLSLYDTMINSFKAQVYMNEMERIEVPESFLE